MVQLPLGAFVALEAEPDACGLVLGVLHASGNARTLMVQWDGKPGFGRHDEASLIRFAPPTA